MSVAIPGAIRARISNDEPFRFYLGTHETSWLERTSHPLFISHRRLAKRKRLPKAAGRWSLDSGGFTELQMHGRWTVSAEAYIDAVGRYATQIGGLDWAAPQDWMCEPQIIDGGTFGPMTFTGTGLSVQEHQVRTVDNFLELTARAPELPFIPVLQGYTVADYHRCIDLYASAGVDLSNYATVGVGSVCRRQHTDEIAELMASLHSKGLRLHGFGVKTTGLADYGWALASADSLSWSYTARFADPLPGHTHKSCANCITYALQWRDRVLSRVATRRMPYQPALELAV